MTFYRLTTVLTLLASQAFAQEAQSGDPVIAAIDKNPQQSSEFFEGLFQENDLMMERAAVALVGTCVESATKVNRSYEGAAQGICTTDISRAYTDRLQNFHSAIRQTVLNFASSSEIAAFLLAKSQGQDIAGFPGFQKLMSSEFKQTMANLSRDWMLRVYYDKALPDVLTDLKNLNAQGALQFAH